MGESGLAAKPHAIRHGARAALARAGAYQFAFELSEPAKDSQHKPPVRGRGDGRQRVQQVAGGSRQPVKPRHRQHVALFKRADSEAQLGAVGPRAAGRLAKNLLGSGGAKLLYPSKPSMYFFALAIISSRVRAFMTSAPLRPIKESK